MRARTQGSNYKNLQNQKLFKSLSLVFVVFICLLAEPGFTGSGKLENGKFNISISVRFDADDATLDALRVRFQEASELLFDATDGQHQFGTIFVCNNSRGGENADFWILQNGSPAGCSDGLDDDGDGAIDEERLDGMDNDGDGSVDEDNACARSYVPGGCVPGLGTDGCRIMLYEDDVLTAGNANADGRHVIVHEFGHYGYGIYDEYQDNTGNTVGIECLESPFTPASLMENFWNRAISEFCVSDNHDPDADTWQDDERAESSWETMSRFFPDLMVPAGLPDDPPPAGADAIDWVVLEPETRLVLVIDRSGSMGGAAGFDPNKIRFAREGAKQFADLVSIGDKIGVISYANDARIDFPLTEITDETVKDEAKTAIDGIISNGSTNIGDGLRDALGQILGAGERACQQVIVLLTNGEPTTGEDPVRVLADLKDAGVIVHTIGLAGNTLNVALLQQIADETLGRFFAVGSVNVPLIDADFLDLLTAFSNLLAESTENGGLITSALAPIMTGETIEEMVPIDALTSEASFLISWSGEGNLDLTLFRPNGMAITPDVALGDPNISFFSGSNHELYTVTGPQSGGWTMRLAAIDVTGQVEVRSIGLGISADISLTATPNKASFVYPEPVLIRAAPVAPVNVVGATLNGTVGRPDGSQVPVEFHDDGLEVHGDETAEDGVYSSFFSEYNENGAYSFEVVASTSSGFLFSGEGLFSFPDLDSIPPQGASSVPAPTFSRTAGFAVTVVDVPVDTNSLSCQIRILSPRDSSFVCDENIKVIASVNIIDGTSPFNISWDINGIGTSPGDTSITTTIPLEIGYNQIIATSTIVDSLGQISVCADTISVFSDPTPAICVLDYNDYPDINGTVTDNESGIARFEVQELENRILILDGVEIAPGQSVDFNGETEFTFVLKKIDVNATASFDMTTTNRAGCAIMCDPIDLTLRSEGPPCNFSFALPPRDRWLYVDNHGLTRIEFVVNEKLFNLKTTGGLANEANAYAIPGYGTVGFDLKQVLLPGENNFRLNCEGPPGSYANIIIADYLRNDVGVPEELEFEEVVIPKEFALMQNFPNPFNPETKIRFNIPDNLTEGVQVKLRIYNLTGQLVKTLVDEHKFPGQYTARWDGGNQRGELTSSGIYIYQLVAGDFKMTKRMVFLK